MTFTFINAYQLACGCSIVRNDDFYIGLYWHTDDFENYGSESYHLAAILPQLRDPQPHFTTFYFHETETYCRAHYEICSEGGDIAEYPAEAYESARECWRSRDFDRSPEFCMDITEVPRDMKTKLFASAWLTRYEADLAGDEDG